MMNYVKMRRRNWMKSKESSVARLNIKINKTLIPKVSISEWEGKSLRFQTSSLLRRSLELKRKYKKKKSCE